MDWDYDDCVKYFYIHDFEDRFPEVDYDDDGPPLYKDLTREQLEIVEKAYDFIQRENEALDDLRRMR